MSLRLVPLRQRDAAAFVQMWHRHNAPPPGDLFRVGVADENDTLVAVGVAGRPVARNYDDGGTVEVTRIASDGTRNACSMLYGALTRAAYALGYHRVITYTRSDEPGASLRAANWKVIGEREPRRGWSTPSRPRDNDTYDAIGRTLWEAS